MFLLSIPPTQSERKESSRQGMICGEQGGQSHLYSQGLTSDLSVKNERLGSNAKS